MSTYKDHRGFGWFEDTPGPAVLHSWAIFTHARLTWHYGPVRAHQIARGKDEETNADVARWNALGRRGAA